MDDANRSNAILTRLWIGASNFFHLTTVEIRGENGESSLSCGKDCLSRGF